MDRGEAERLLALSREAEWAFPTSYSESRLAPPGADWVGPMVAERESLAAAVVWLADAGEDEAAAELAANVWRLWLLAGDRDGGRAFLAPVVDRPGPASPGRARALYGAGLIAIKQGRRDESLARNEEALRVADEAGDAVGRTLALLGLSRVALEDRDHARGAAHARDALAAAAGLPERMRQAPLHMLAQHTRMSGDLDGAAELFRRSLALNRSVDDAGMVPVELHNLGHVEARRGNADAAEALFAEAESLGGEDPYDAAMNDLNRGVVALLRGDAGTAGAMVERVRAGMTAAGLELAPDDALELERLAEGVAGGPA